MFHPCTPQGDYEAALRGFANSILYLFQSPYVFAESEGLSLSVFLHDAPTGVSVRDGLFFYLRKSLCFRIILGSFAKRDGVYSSLFLFVCGKGYLAEDLAPSEISLFED